MCRRVCKKKTVHGKRLEVNQTTNDEANHDPKEDYAAMNKRLDEELERFMRRGLEEQYPYVILDARYERVRQEGVIRSRAVLVAIGVDWEGRRQILGVELANRESSSSWKEFLLGLKSRGLRGVLFVVSGDHPGLRSAIAEILPEGFWQRCYVHFLRNALDYLPRKADDDCLTELRWFYERRNVEEARRDLAAWLAKWQGKYPPGSNARLIHNRLFPGRCAAAT